MQRNPISLRHEDNEEDYSLREHTDDCTCDECGTTYNKPLLAMNTSNGSDEQYYACPRCLTKVREVETREKEQSHEATPVRDLNRAGPVPENDVKCQHFLGYLKKRPKDMPIPDGCLTCSKMVECLYM
jgi:hypothetical protein